MKLFGAKLIGAGKIATSLVAGSALRFAGLAALLLLAGCASGPASQSPPPGRTVEGTVPHRKVGSPYVIDGRRYVPAHDKNYSERGIASWYGAQFNGKPTANGEIFDMTALTAAHRTLPLPSIVEVTNLANGRKITVRVNDRGPFSKDRIIDLSRAAAEKLGFLQAGTTKVHVRFLRDATLDLALKRLGDRRAIVQLEHELRNDGRVDVIASTGPVEAGDDPVSGLIFRSINENPSIDPVTPHDQQFLPVRVSDRYRIQVGAFSDPNRAEQIRLQLGNQVPVDMKELREPGRPPLYRIFAGGFASRDQALAYLPAVRAAGYRDAFVVETLQPQAQF